MFVGAARRTPRVGGSLDLRSALRFRPAVIRVLALLRHGLASGQGPDAALLPEGAVELRRLGDMLNGEGWRPAAVTTSPYRRARESALVLATMLAPGVEPHVLPALRPEEEPAEALAAVLRAAPLASPILIVSHLPLVGRLAHELVGEDIGFSPGTLVEIIRDGDGGSRLLRRIGPRDLPGGFRGRG
jgi:phosphohistidine phosphatase